MSRLFEGIKKNKAVVVALIAVLLVYYIVMSFDWLPHRPAELAPTNNLPEVTSAQLKLQELYQPDRDSYGNGIYIDNAAVFRYRVNLSKLPYDPYRNDTKMIEDYEASKTTTFKIRDAIELYLPPLPADFWKYKYTLLTKGFLDFGNISEAYWKQPEFIEICTGKEIGSCVNSFKQNAVPYFKEKNTGIWFREGTATFPAIQYADSYAGAEFSTYVIWQTAWNVETYQGFKIVPKYPSSVAGNVIGKYDIVLSYMYITVKDISPETLLLEPAYPIVKRGYNQLVKITFKIAEGTPAGDYLVAFEETRLPKDIEEKYYTKYLALYQPKSSLTSTTIPKLQVIISIR